jgi:hypothetical protein
MRKQTADDFKLMFIALLVALFVIWRGSGNAPQ